MNSFRLVCFPQTWETFPASVWTLSCLFSVYDDRILFDRILKVFVSVVIAEKLILFSWSLPAKLLYDTIGSVLWHIRYLPSKLFMVFLYYEYQVNVFLLVECNGAVRGFFCQIVSPFLLPMALSKSLDPFCWTEGKLSAKKSHIYIKCSYSSPNV